MQGNPNHQNDLQGEGIQVSSKDGNMVYTNNNGPDLEHNGIISNQKQKYTTEPELFGEGHFSQNNEKNIQGAINASHEKNLIIKNIAIISVGFFLNATAYRGLVQLQSSLHHDEGMGVINQSILYACLVISCFFVPKLMVSAIGHKWTMPICFSGHILWMAANGYAVWATMIPGSILLGLSAAPLWTAQCSYFTIVGARYAKLTGGTEEAVVTHFFGIFFCIYQMSTIAGSIISSVILTPKNSTPVPENWSLDTCGRNDCPGGNLTATGLNHPSHTTVWVLVGTYIGAAVLAVILVSIFVDPLPDRYVQRQKVQIGDMVDLITVTVKHLQHKDQLLLIPLTIYRGMEEAFYWAEFNASYVTCTVGIWKVGSVTIGFGVINAITSFASGRAIKYTGRLPIFTSALLVHLGVQITLQTWMPHPSEEYVLYVLACMWGFSDAIWLTQIKALYGVLFVAESEAAFSNYHVWEAVGFIIGFAYSPFLCTYIKTYITMALLIVGFAGYMIVEYGQYQSKKWMAVAGAEDNLNSEMTVSRNMYNFAETEKLQ